MGNRCLRDRVGTDGVRYVYDLSLAGQWFDGRVYTSHSMHVRRQGNNRRQLQ